MVYRLYRAVRSLHIHVQVMRQGETRGLTLYILLTVTLFAVATSMWAVDATRSLFWNSRPQRRGIFCLFTIWHSRLLHRKDHRRTGDMNKIILELGLPL
ncbi:hypothetical protein E1B28_009173 [Marasmius oreades]|nr:uncharacterized protein E1B28_009173 [Marasmius oreades]KAG7092860.1 hypothetical protein E1B28_009173 [Marasmius oreades]